MPRIAFRRILPIVQVVLFVTLVLLDREQELARRAHFETYGGWDARTHQPPSIAFTVAFVMNAPALAFAESILVPLTVVEFGEKWVSTLIYVVTGFGVFGLWYLIGRWLDRRHGLLPTPVARGPRRFEKFLVRAGLLIVIVSGGVALWILLSDPWNWRHLRAQNIAIVVWSALGAWLLVSRVRRWRALARGTASNIPN